MSQYIQHELFRLKTRRAAVIAELQRAILAAQQNYDSQIRELISQCKHKEARSRQYDLPMGYCEYCETDMTKPIGQ